MMAATVDHKDSDTANGHDVVDHCVNIVPRTTSAVQSQIAAGSKQLADTLTLRTAKRSLALLHQQTNGGKSNKPAAVETPPTQAPDTMPKTTGTTRRKSSFPTLEKLPLFQQFRKRGGSAPAIHSITPPSKDARPTFVKSSSIARLFGNTYSTAAAKEAASTPDTSANGQTITAKASASTKASQSSSTITAERFHACTNDADQLQLLNDEHCVAAAAAPNDASSAASAAALSAHLYGDDFDVALNPFRSLSRGLGRLFFKKSYSVKISDPDPEFKVAYLGNVLTGWAKGE